MTGKHLKTAWAAAVCLPLLGVGGCSTVQVVERSVCDTACQKAAERSERLGIVQVLNDRVAAFEKAGDKKNANATALVLTHYIRGSDPALDAALKKHVKEDTLTNEMMQKLAAGVRFSTKVVPCKDAAVKPDKICAEARPAANSDFAAGLK